MLKWRKRAEVQSVGTAEAPTPLSPRDEAIAVLKQGVKAWNAWVAEKRKADPKFRADLSKVDFTNEEWRTTSLWRKPAGDWPMRICLFEGILNPNYEQGIDLRNADLFDCVFSDVFMPGALMLSADVPLSNFQDAYLLDANFKNATAYGCCFDGAMLTGANFDGANLHETRFGKASLIWTRVHAANLKRSDFTGTTVERAIYAKYRGWPIDVFPFNSGFWPLKKNLMLGCFNGIRGLDSCYGDPSFCRDARDQDFIDSLYEDVRLIPYAEFAPSWKRPYWFLRSLFKCLPGRLAFALWGFFDYGRSILSLLIFAALIVFATGCWYQALEATNAISFGGHVAEITQADGALYQLRPWFAAFMGFATLGLTDIIAPHNWKGALVMCLNVLAGFSTLGLFIAVFQNKFARRS